jgi:hypothetical protein
MAPPSCSGADVSTGGGGCGGARGGGGGGRYSGSCASQEGLLLDPFPA